MEQLVEQILRSPKLEIYLKQINAARVDEQASRRLFLEQLTEDDHAEFINGQAVFHSPVKFAHDNCRRRLKILFEAFVTLHKLGYVAGENVMISLTRNDYEPDIKFWPSKIAEKFEPKQTRFPVPVLIVEVLSPSTEANDRGVKFEDYAAHGVGEYWIVDPDKQILEQYQLCASGSYELSLKSDSGLIRSAALAGFEIPIAAVFDDQQNLETLRSLLL